ncbi:pyridoxamine 5'-phosphate oxidase family protein [Streptomyces sp. NBC_00353]|uniref:pyridoxamine 5'-phosphate oxidase family protein n=1 Tax=unclassified Streptomyces TaxID=2593676 RepID=UPI002E253460
MTTPVSRRMVEVPGSEALWLLEGGAQGHVGYVRREIPVVRPPVHILEYGCLIVRTPAQTTTLACRPSLSHRADEIKTAGGIGWTVTATGPAEIITDPDEAGHYRRILPGWAHGPRDTLVRIRPQMVTGFRLAHAEAVR